jgi:hypothetical protein
MPMEMTRRFNRGGGPPTLHRLWTAALAAAVLLLAALAAGAQETVAPFCYTGLSEEVRVVVDVNAARHRGGEKFIPLMVYVGCSGAKGLRLDPKAFSLREPDGAVSPLATREQIQDKKLYGYFKVADDYTFLWNNLDRGPVRMAFNGLGYMKGTCFFPNVGGVPYLVRDEVDLIPYAFTRVLLYFANPLGKSSDIYILIYKDPHTAIEVQVPLRIHWD